MFSKTSESKKIGISKTALIIAVITCLACCVSFYLYPFAPFENKLPITENVGPGSSLNMRVVYQGNKDVYYANNIVIEGTRAYVLGEDDASIYILDISNPELPVVENIYDPADFFANHIQAQGNFLYLATDVFEIMDVTHANNPSVVWQFHTLEPIKNIAVSNNFAYVIDASSNLYIIDISEPTKPKLVKQIEKFNHLDYIDDATVSNNFLYIASYGLYVFDISNPTQPVKIGYYGLPYKIDYFDGVTISNRTAWVSGHYRDVFGDSQWHTLFLDISNPSKPTLISTYDHYPLANSDNILCFYDAPTDESIHLMDFSNPTKPIELGYIGYSVFNSLGYPGAITSKDNFIYIYLENYSDGLTVIKYIPLHP